MSKDHLTLHDLGRCLIFVGDEQNAVRAFEHDISIIDGQIHHLAKCDRCRPDDSIRGMDRFKCKTCRDHDFCQSCFDVFRDDEKAWSCKSHEFLRIPRPEFTPSTQEQKVAWLHELQRQYS